MNTYIVRMYFKDLDEKVKEVVFQCKPTEVDEYAKKEIETCENIYNRKATDVMILMKVKDLR